MNFDDSLIAAFARTRKLANHMHLPVQSGSDRILALMRRGYTVLEFKQKLRRLRAVRPDIPVSTDIIVGFPGETERDFQQTLDLTEEVGFDQSFSFIYSRRPGTPAASLPDDVTAEVKSAAPGAPAGACSIRRRGRSRAPWWAACSACWWSGLRGATRDSSPAAPRTIAG